MDSCLLNCVELGYSDDGYMEDSHPMFYDACGCTYEAIVPPCDSQLQCVHPSKDGMLST
jgi:hypothetical protein